MTVDEVMLYGKVYQWAKSKMYHEIPSRLVPCSLRGGHRRILHLWRSSGIHAAR